jgi:hypothetical protein
MHCRAGLHCTFFVHLLLSWQLLQTTVLQQQGIGCQPNRFNHQESSESPDWLMISPGHSGDAILEPMLRHLIVSSGCEHTRQFQEHKDMATFFKTVQLLFTARVQQLQVFLQLHAAYVHIDLTLQVMNAILVRSAKY